MRILLAEDDRSLSRGLCVLLSRNGYTVDCVFDGESAMDYVHQTAYDGLILDVMMPRRDGISVLKMLREQGCDVPVLLLTAKAEMSDKIAGLDAGADDYITKPFISEELLARLRALMRRRDRYTDSALAFEDLKLDRTTLLLSRGEQSVRLNNKAFQMMEMFMLHPHQVLSAQHLLETLWGWDSEAEIHVVWVNASQLRKQMAALGSRVTLKTIRGVGYSLEAER